MAPFGPFLTKDEIEKINRAQREGAKSGYGGKPSPSPYNKVTPSVKNSKTDKMVAKDKEKYGNTFPSGSFGSSQKGAVQPKVDPTPTPKTQTQTQPAPTPTPTPTPTPAPGPTPTPTLTPTPTPKTQTQLAPKPTPTPTNTAPTTPEKPPASKDPSIERRLPQGAERVDKMADRVRELRAMRSRSQSRTMAQGGKPSTSMVVPSAKIEKPRSVNVGGRRSMRENMDAFDIILDYLLENGHVDSLDEALYVMMEMDSKVIQEIVSEETEDSLRDRRQERGGVDGNQRYPSDKGVKKGAMSPEEKKKSREKSKSALDHVRSSITKQYGAGAIYKKKEKKDKDKDED